MDIYRYGHIYIIREREREREGGREGERERERKKENDKDIWKLKKEKTERERETQRKLCIHISRQAEASSALRSFPFSLRGPPSRSDRNRPTKGGRYE